MGSGLEFVDLVDALRHHIGEECDKHPQVGALVLNTHPFQGGLDVPNLARHEVKKQSAQHIVCNSQCVQRAVQAQGTSPEVVLPRP